MFGRIKTVLRPTPIRSWTGWRTSAISAGNSTSRPGCTAGSSPGWACTSRLSVALLLLMIVHVALALKYI